MSPKTGGRSISGFDRRTGELLWSTGDDMVGYQTLTVLTIGGRPQVVAVTNHRLLGLVPETGQVLWQHEHAFRGEGIAYPLLVAENRILLNHIPEAALFQVTRRDGKNAVEEVWRSEALRTPGNMLAGEEPMHRIPGTDFYYRSLKLEPGTHFLYHFKIFEEFLPDPLNPRRFGSEEWEQSELAMPGWELPRHLSEPPAHRGRIEKLPWKSKILDNERQVRVYLPPGYDTSQERYPLLLVAAGGGRGESDPDALALGEMDHSLDYLIGKSVAPLVVAFVPILWPDHNPGSPQFAKALAEELIPRIDETYRTAARPEARGIMGVHDCSFAALYAVFDQPGLFGKAAVVSFFQRDLRDELTARIEKGEKLEVDFYIEWSRHGWTDPVRGRDAGVDTRQLAEMLGKRGYRLHTVEVGDGFSWASWRTRTARILETLFPLK